MTPGWSPDDPRSILAIFKKSQFSTKIRPNLAWLLHQIDLREQKEHVGSKITKIGITPNAFFLMDSSSELCIDPTKVQNSVPRYLGSRVPSGTPDPEFRIWRGGLRPKFCLALRGFGVINKKYAPFTIL